MFIWVINALSKQYTTTVELSIIYKGLPASVLPTQLPQKLITEISGRGFDLMQYSFSNHNRSLIIDLDKLPSSVFAGNISTIRTTQLLKENNSGEKNQITFNRVTPEIIQLNSRERFSKKVPVKADIKFSFKKQYARSGAFIIQPDSIFISGDSLMVKKIKEVKTIPANFDQLDHPLFHSVKIIKEDNSTMIYSTDKVWVYMKVEPFTEGTMTIPVTIANSGMKQITLVPDIVTVSYHVPLSLYNTIRSEQFEVTTYLPDKSESNTLKVKVSRKPIDVTDVNVTPQQVDFFIRQK